jgi:putative hydrolase of the HAD superfamily
VGDARSFDAVSLDAGGVLVVPDQGLLGWFLTAAGVDHDPDRFTDGHYHGVAAVDRAQSAPETFDDYIGGLLRAVGVHDDQMDAGRAALAQILVPPVWRQPLPGALAAARRLAAAGFPLAVTSNADGNVAASLARHEICQCGPGAGFEVCHVGDSGVLGVAKPDPAIFLATADALGLPPERVCHVGDSGWYDAHGAAAVGMVAVHVDPLGLCADGDHEHVASLADFVDGFLGPFGPD